MKAVSARSNVRLNAVETQKFLQRMQSDPAFSRKLSAVLHTNDETRISEFLKRNGFKF